MPFIFSDAKNPNSKYLLHELYQPIYKHSEQDYLAKRNCYDRLESIEKIYLSLEKYFGRHLKVLDLGCAQGFFSFNLAKLGGIVTAADSDKISIKFCELLAQENPDLKINFVCAKIEDILSEIQVGEYDLVLGLSIFAELYKADGFDEVKKIISDLDKKVAVCLFETETAKEIQADFFPEKYTSIFDDFRIVRCVAVNVADNPEFKRPLFFASNDYFFSEGLGILKIDYANNHNVIGGEKFFCLYCFCGDKFVKVIKAFNANLLERAENEINFLENLGGGGDFPKLYEAYRYYDEFCCKIFIIRDKFEGVTLQEKIENEEDFDRWDVIKKILSQVVFLEEHGYYHDDLFQHNILYDNGKIHIIDYESISEKKSPVILRNFFMLMNCILENESNFYPPLKMLTHLKKHIGSKKYYQIAKIKTSEKFFKRLYEILFESDDEENIEDYTAAECEIMAIEEILESEIKRLHKFYSEEVKQIAETLTIMSEGCLRKFTEQQQRIEMLEKIIWEMTQKNNL